MINLLPSGITSTKRNQQGQTMNSRGKPSGKALAYQVLKNLDCLYSFSIKLASEMKGLLSRQLVVVAVISRQKTNARAGSHCLFI